MKLFLIAVVGSSGLFAQTCVNDTYNNLDGSPFNGSITVTAPIAFKSGSFNVAAGAKSYLVTNGAIAVCLIPTDAAVPATNYSVQFITRTNTSSSTWSVPTSAAPVTLQTVTITPVVLTASAVLNCFIAGANGAGLNCPNGFQAGDNSQPGAVDLIGTNGQAITHVAPASPTAYAIQWPAAAGTNGTALKVSSVSAIVINNVSVTLLVMAWQ